VRGNGDPPEAVRRRGKPGRTPEWLFGRLFLEESHPMRVEGTGGAAERRPLTGAKCEG
jgi:hypothetical protein